MVVNTKTVCAFPFAAPPGVNATVPSDCTITYGQALGAGHIVMQTILLATGALGTAVFGYRLIALRRYCTTKNIPYKTHPTLVHFVLCFVFGLFLVISSIDPYGFWGVLPIEMYAVFDEICAATAISNGLMIVRFLYKMSHNMTNPKKRDANLMVYCTVAAVWVNFVGFIIPGVIDHPNFKLYEGLKSTFGALILIIFLYLARQYALQLREFMCQMASQVNDRKRLDRNIKTLDKKQFRFSSLVAFGSLVLIANAVLSFTTPDRSWTLVVAELPDPAQIAIRVVYILNTLVTISFFRVPSSTSVDSSQDDTGPNSPTSPSSSKGNAITRTAITNQQVGSYAGTDGTTA